MVEQSPTATWFQTPECYAFYRSLSCVEAFVFGVEEDGVLCGLLTGFIQRDGNKLMQFFSRRAIVNGGLLLSDEISDEALTLLLRSAIEQLREKVIYIELRNFCDYSRWRPVIEQSGFRYQRHFDCIIPTPDEERMWSGIDKRRRQTLRAAMREGAVIDENPSSQDICDYYLLLSEMYHRRLHLPLLPNEFFVQLAQQPFTKMFIVKYEGRVIGGQVSIAWQGRAVYDLYLTGLDKQYHKQSPSAVGMLAGLQYAARNDFPVLDLMGAGHPDEEYGVREFKLQYGGELKEFGRFVAVENKFLYRLGVWCIRAWQRLLR